MLPILKFVEDDKGYAVREAIAYISYEIIILFTEYY